MAATFKIGSSGLVTSKDFKELKFTQNADEKAITADIKAQLKSSMQAPLKREYDQAMAYMDPVGALNKRFEARQTSLNSAEEATGKWIDEAFKAGLPLGQIQAMANSMAGNFLTISNQTAELAAPSGLARAAQGVLGVPTATSTKRAAPRRRRASPKKKGGKSKGKK